MLTLLFGKMFLSQVSGINQLVIVKGVHNASPDVFCSSNKRLLCCKTSLNISYINFLSHAHNLFLVKNTDIYCARIGCSEGYC